MAEQFQKSVAEPVLVVGTLKVYADKSYEIRRRVDAPLPSVGKDKLTSGVVYSRGGKTFSNAQPVHIVTGSEVVQFFTLTKRRTFETDPVTRVFDPNLTIREITKAELEARG